ncbi:WAS/WASL-interacting protein family member 1-like, partial [Daubentonia madagascariensis]
RPAPPGRRGGRAHTCGRGTRRW